MKLYQSFKYLLLILIASIGFSGCYNISDNGPKSIISDNPSASVTDVTLSLTIPNYQKETFQNKVIDPATWEVVVTVTGPGMANMSQTFNFANNGYWYSDGYGMMQCAVKVPVGLDRVFQVITKDQTGNLLTTGSTVPTDISFNVYNDLSLTLLPCNFIQISADQTVTGSVDYGKMVYFQIDLGTSPLSEVTVQSPANANLYTFCIDGNQYWDSSVWDSGSGVKKIVLGNHQSSNNNSSLYYLGVYGSNAGGTSNFTLSSHTVTGSAFASNFTCKTVVSAAFSSIAATGTEVWQYNSMNSDLLKAVPLDFNFVFHGTEYNTVYVSQDGVISFWPYYRLSGWELGGDLPNNLIALYMRDFYLRHNAGQRIYYQITGTAPNRKLIIEYHHIQTDYSDSEFYLTGQIVLYETSNSIQLIYDRSNCNLMGQDGIIGLENEDGSSTLGPGLVCDVPAEDYEFSFD
ncbi:MAG TPA: hypothetical protein VHY08_12825 [Bacillota bacterium]|nr:hypothetical protein [Bacillota bacterium]